MCAYASECECVYTSMYLCANVEVRQEECLEHLELELQLSEECPACYVDAVV